MCFFGLDQNKDGIVSSTELDEWLKNLQRVAASQRPTRRKEATNRQLLQLGLISGIPFIGKISGHPPVLPTYSCVHLTKKTEFSYLFGRIWVLGQLNHAHCW